MRTVLAAALIVLSGCASGLVELSPTAERVVQSYRVGEIQEVTVGSPFLTISRQTFPVGWGTSGQFSFEIAGENYQIRPTDVFVVSEVRVNGVSIIQPVEETRHAWGVSIDESGNPVWRGG